MKTFCKFTLDLMTDVFLKLISSFKSNELFCFNYEVVQHRVVTSHRTEQRQRRLTRRAEQLVELRRKKPGDILMILFNILLHTDAF